MKGGTVQINWHDTKPVLTLDFHPLTGILATGGADFDIKMWLIKTGETQKKIPTASYQHSLSYHSSAVNVLRFSPSGEQLASGADGGELMIWKLHNLENGQTWKALRSLSFHRKDVLDLQWSTDGAYLVSGSVDNSCIIWDMNKGSVHQILDAHLHYVQGVAWDPLGKYVASLSSDRTCRIYVNKPKKSKGNEKMNYVCQHVISKAEQLVDNSKSAKGNLFHDETLPSFFRRLAWSPDGSFLLVPAGSYKVQSSSESINMAYVFSRKDLSRPALQLPGASKAVVAVRFCPIMFKLRGTNTAVLFKLPYRLMFAVATLNSLCIYDTESTLPIAVLAGLHYAAITDISWSPDAHYLALSSQDGYCTVLEFGNDELGLPLSLSEKEAFCIDGKSSLRKAEDMIVDTTGDGGTVARGSGKSEVEKNIEKEALTPTCTPTSVKPSKRRITPIVMETKEGLQNDIESSLQKVDTVAESTCSGDMVSAESVKRGAENDGEKVASTPSCSHSSYKPTGMQIIPMEIETNEDFHSTESGESGVEYNGELAWTSFYALSVDKRSERLIQPMEIEAKEVLPRDGKVSMQKAEDLTIKENGDHGPVVLDGRKTETENNDGKKVTNNISSHTSNKPAKRRITPMAIDP